MELKRIDIGHMLFEQMFQRSLRNFLTLLVLEKIAILYKVIAFCGHDRRLLAWYAVSDEVRTPFTVRKSVTISQIGMTAI